MDLQELREAVRLARETSPSPRFEPDLRAKLIAAAHELYARGVSMVDISDRLGIARGTVSRYLDAVPPKLELELEEADGFVAVEVPATLGRRITVTLPSGVRIEGLELDDVVALARALS